MSIIDTHFMEFVLRTAMTSDDPSVQNAAALVYEDEVLGAGVNQIPYGVHDIEERWERPDKYLWVEHAERNAIYNTARNGGCTEGATMYCPWAACADCARAIIQSGVFKLVRLEMNHAEGWSHSIDIGDRMMQEAGIQIVELTLDSVEIPEGLRLGQYRDV